MKNYENSINVKLSVKKSWLKVISFAFIAVLAVVVAATIPQNNDDFTISKAGLLSFANTTSNSQQGKYMVATNSSTVNGAVQTQIIVMNTQTGQSKLYQLFNDEHGGGWKVIELSSSKYNLGIPKANF